MKLIKYKMDELYEMGSGISTEPEQAGHGAPFVSFGTVFNNYFMPDVIYEKMDSTAEEQDKYSVKAGDIFITRTSETLDELAMSCVAINDYPNATFSGFVKRLRPLQTDKTYAKFMGFFMRSPYFRKIVNNNALLTLRASFNEDIFSYIYICLPSYDVQVRIGDFLYDIYQKIELNKKENAKLEYLARITYDYWFSQYEFPNENGQPYKSSKGKMEENKLLKRKIPKGWQTGNLYDIADFVNGLACQKYRPKEGDGHLPVIKIKEMRNGITPDTEVVRDTIPEKNIINDGDILFSWSASLETMIWTGGKAGLNQHIFKVVPKGLGSYYTFQQLRSYIINLKMIAAARKTTMGHITTDHLKQSIIVIPPKEIALKFNEEMKPIYEKMIHNDNENHRLNQFINNFITMLVNGQIDIKSETKK